MWFNRLVKGALFGALYSTPCLMVAGFIVTYLPFPRDPSKPNQESAALATAIMLIFVGFWYGAFAGAFTGGLVALFRLNVVTAPIFVLFLGTAVCSFIFVFSAPPSDSLLYYLSATMIVVLSFAAALVGRKMREPNPPRETPALATASE